MGLALLVMLVLPAAQIRLGAAQLSGLVGSYTSGSDPGHYWKVSYVSSGSATFHYMFGQSATDPIYSGGGPWTDTDGETYAGGSAGGQYATDAVSFGTVTATLTWVPASGQSAQDDPPPNQVIVAETGYASWNGGTSPGKGSASDGLGDAEVDSSQAGTSSGTHYSVQDGTSGTITLSHTLSAQSAAYAPPPFGSTYGQAIVSYSVTPYPITIDLGGTTNGQVLTGQQVGASLNTSGLPATGYEWTVAGGDPFLNYDPYAPSNQLTALPQPGSQDHFDFYTKAAGQVTVACLASVLVSSNPQQYVIVDVQKKLASVKPTVAWQTNQDPIFQNMGLGFSSDASQMQANELWTPINITVPLPFSGGKGGLAQLITPDRRLTRRSLNGKPTAYSYKIPSSPGSNNYVIPGQGLDGHFPYPHGLVVDANGNSSITSPPEGYTWDVSQSGSSGDTVVQPYTTGDVDQGGTDWRHAHASDAFVTWVMYRPPSKDPYPTVWVPLQTLTWNWNGEATKDDASGAWTATGSAAVIQPPTDTPNPPQWSVILQATDQLQP